MSFQAYLDNIKAKTGKTPEDFKRLADKKGLLRDGVKAGEIVLWLKTDFRLGHGHAMAIYTAIMGSKEKKTDKEGLLNQHFTAEKQKWRSVFDHLMEKLNRFGDDVSIAPTHTYISVLRGERKMAVIYISNDRMDIGIKLKDADTTERFEAAGSWNAMMTHRVRIFKEEELDKELFDWLQLAYQQNKPKQ